MKPVFVAIKLLPGESFVIEDTRTPGGSSLFNFHAGWQITLVLLGEGQRFVGDSIAPYRAGDLVMLGPGLPHMWRERHAQQPSHSLLIDFNEDFLGAEFLRRPEMAKIRELCENARRGLRFKGETQRAGAALMRAIPAASGARRVLRLLELLDLFSLSTEVEALASPGYEPAAFAPGDDKLTAVFSYITDNLTADISRAPLARLVGLSESAFSRYFAARVGRSVPEFVNEVRIGRACRLLMETNQGVTDIARACGYTSLGSFHRSFHAVKKMAPGEYRARMRRERPLG